METNNTRRKFIKVSASTLFFGSLFGGGLYFTPQLNGQKIFLRPPGAVDEKEFLSTCIKCGQCVQVCPYHTLSLLDIKSGNSIGTPHVDARSRGCYLCDLLPCVLACPSGSLNHDITQANQVQMGIAFLKNPTKCLALNNTNVKQEDIASILEHSNQNEREAKVLENLQNYVEKPCTICADLCPYPQKEKAIVMAQNQNGQWYPEVKNECVGCGVCEELCPAQDEAAIIIIPRKKYSEVYQ